MVRAPHGSHEEDNHRLNRSSGPIPLYRLWSQWGHARRERLTGGVRIVRGQSVRISIREQRGRLPERVGASQLGTIQLGDVERGVERGNVRGAELRDFKLSHIDQLACFVGGLVRGTKCQRYDVIDERRVHVERVVVAGLGLVRIDEHREPHHDL